MSKVTFGGGHVALFGILGGVLIALGVSGFALMTPQDIGVGARVSLTLGALIAGGAVAFVSAFFGAVMPKEVEDDDEGRGKAKGGVNISFGGKGGMNISEEKPQPSAGDEPKT
jgi:hypothetical protein